LQVMEVKTSKLASLLAKLRTETTNARKGLEYHSTSSSTRFQKRLVTFSRITIRSYTNTACEKTSKGKVTEKHEAKEKLSHAQAKD
jgi:hypothetical protein